MKVRILSENAIQRFEDQINKEIDLLEQRKATILDIKFTETHSDSS